jgi:NAD-dependent dihydropyrimidine dehydrogenase PreA subunit
LAAESGDNACPRLTKTWRGPWIDKDRCVTCGEEFTASRRDAKICSDGCKQEAYRRREKEVRQYT